MNGYQLSRDWFNFRFENPSRVRAVHTELYLYLVDQWNRLGQKTEIGLPTKFTMDCLGIGSYNTFKKTLSDLVDWGFVKILKDSANQHQSKIIALSKNDKATTKALDKASIKASDESRDTIIEQGNKGTREQQTSNTVGKPDEVALIVSEINKLSGSVFKASTKETKKYIQARLKENSLEDCLKVVRAMWEKWRGDEKMKQHFVPVTLFRESNFEKYLQTIGSSQSKNIAPPSAPSLFPHLPPPDRRRLQWRWDKYPAKIESGTWEEFDLVKSGNPDHTFTIVREYYAN